MKFRPGDRLIENEDRVCRSVCRVLSVHQDSVEVVFEKPIRGPLAKIKKLDIGDGRRWQKKGQTIE